MKIGIVVHGPEIVDSGYAEEIMRMLQKYGEIKARLGGTMGRTAVLDAKLEDDIDINRKLLPSHSIRKFTRRRNGCHFPHKLREIQFNRTCLRLQGAKEMQRSAPHTD